MVEGARQGDARPALQDAVAESRAGVGKAVPPVAAVCASRGEGSKLRVEDGVGAAEFLCVDQRMSSPRRRGPRVVEFRRSQPGHWVPAWAGTTAGGDRVFIRQTELARGVRW